MPDLTPLTAEERQTLRSVLVRELLSPPLAAVGPLVFRLLAQVEAQEVSIAELERQVATLRAALEVAKGYVFDPDLAIRWDLGKVIQDPKVEAHLQQINDALKEVP